MAEEDEIDVLGEFNVDNYLPKSDCNLYGSSSLVSQNTDLLNCDYTIHPQWLLDKPSANPDNWYDTNCTSPLDKIQTENESLGLVSTEDSISDESGWTEKEKNLLEGGIEIFGKSNLRLSQFIGSKTPSEVKYYLKNFHVDSQSSVKNFNDIVFDEINDSSLITDVLNDTQIPASIEEVIEAVSTAKPTVEVHKKNRKKNVLFSTNDMFDVNLESNQTLKSSSVYAKKHNTHRNKLHPMQYEMKLKLKSTAKPNKIKHCNPKIMDNSDEKLFSKVEITTGKGLAVPICEGEEIVKIQKTDDESDLDVEVNVEDSDEELKIDKPNPVSCSVKMDEKLENPNEASWSREKINLGAKPFVDLSTVDESIIKELMSLETPRCETILHPNTVTELEKIIHFEYFEGRPVKTPVRYLKIRNQIVNIWKAQKPVYVTKTSIRQGLKNCGDVNSIGRIHYFLEQIGAINFGCSQINYVRPLYNMIQSCSFVKDKPVKDVKSQPRSTSVFSSRQRYKRKFNNDGEGGCTLTHDETGHVINTTIVNEEPKQRLYIKKPAVRLVSCRSFTGDNPQPYRIKIHLSTMLKMDFHAHTCLTEVMGLIGGHWIPNEKVLLINHYEPCLNIASSSTHCDMCPISQAKAADIIHSKGLNILGWFHSHPTFAPEPSDQDIETQLTLQQWIGHNKPWIGFILSPFSLSGALIASPFRCMVVDKKFNFEDQMVPYKFKVDLESEEFTFEEFMDDMRQVLEIDFEGHKESRVKFSKPYFQNSSISYLEKYISSVQMHLAKCGTMHKMICDNIIEGITSICSKYGG